MLSELRHLCLWKFILVVINGSLLSLVIELFCNINKVSSSQWWHLSSCMLEFDWFQNHALNSSSALKKWVSNVSKGKGKRSIAVRKKPHRYGNSRAIWDHTVLPATRQRWYSRLHPSRSWYSIKRSGRDARLSWPSWLVTARDGIPARRRSPIPVVTGPDVR